MTVTGIGAAFGREGCHAPDDPGAEPLEHRGNDMIVANAKAIGVDSKSTVDDFCRWFPHGDRRAAPGIRGHAEIVGHADLQWCDHVPPSIAEGDRRGAAVSTPPPQRAHAFPAAAFSQVFVRLRALLRA